MRVCILTTVHPYNDQRIFFKEAHSLAKHFPVILIAPDEFEWSKTVDSIHVVTVKRPKSKLLHFVTLWRVFTAGLETDCSIVHCHEPGSLLVSVLLKILQGKRIVYDSHEHYGALIASDPLFPQPIKRIINAATDLFERLLISFADALSQLMKTSQKNIAGLDIKMSQLYLITRNSKLLTLFRQVIVTGISSMLVGSRMSVASFR